MKHGTSPLIWDLDSSGNTAPTTTPSAAVSPITFNISGLDGRTEDLWNHIDAVNVRVTFTLTSGGAGAVFNRDAIYAVVDSFNLYSPVLGDLLAQRSNQGSAVGLLDQYFGAGYNRPQPMGAQIAAGAGDTTVDVYYRIPLALDLLGRPRDTGVWAPLLEKGKLVVNISPTTADFFQTSFNIKAATCTVRASFEVTPRSAPEIHAPSKFVRYEFNTAGAQLKLFSFGNGDGMLGVNPGARLSMLLWLSNKKLLGGVDTIDKWTRIAMPWRHQRVCNNPDMFMLSYIAGTRTRGVVGSTGATALDSSGTPYIMGGDVPNSLLDSDGLFFPIVWPGFDTDLSSNQKQVGDLQIDAGFSANPNGTHVFRTLEHYSWQPAMVAKLMGLMGFNTRTHTAEPKTHDNTDPRLIADGQLWGLPLRIVERSKARKPVI